MGVLYPIRLRAAKPASEAGEWKPFSGMGRALAHLRPKARACRVLHDAAPGTRVKFKVWFTGKAGAVEAAKALVPRRSAALRTCLEQRVRTGTFPRTGNASEVVLVPFEL